MHLEALTTATPRHSFTQRECWDFIRDSDVGEKLKDRSLKILQKVLLNDNGIEKRHFALHDLEKIFDYDANFLSAAFEREAPLLAARALEEALEKARRLPIEIDALFICTCTGYLCP
ncbi:MAG TPA: stilbene synthase, partial [Opitutales bacterium]|nr:stilbene synthase [Opitutales bacterium]